MAVVFSKTKMLTDAPLHYCPGCTHGIIHRLVAEVIEELGVEDRTIGVAPVGCAVFAYDYFNCDMDGGAARTRTQPWLRASKRVRCRSAAVFTYQGDGDLASIGTAEIVHACTRGEKYHHHFCQQRHLRHDGRTDGSHHAAGTGYHHRRRTAGMPIPLRDSRYGCARCLSTLDGAYYIARVSVDCVKNVINAKKCIKKAFEYQLEGKGFTLVEVLSPAPRTGAWRPTRLLSG